VFETEARPGLERLASKAAKKNRHASLAQREAMDVLQGLYDSDAQPRVVAVATEKLIDQANASLRAIGMRPVVCGG
jgi:hypothetical protein